MQCLRVLDFRKNSRVELLPDSISDLVYLHALRLIKCMRLERVPSLAKLIFLRMLELDGTAIDELPEGIEMLVNLRCLNLNSVRLRETIPIGLIPKLSVLRKLDLGCIDTDKLYVFGSETSTVEELLSLKELENLNISFHCLSDYSSYVGSSKFSGLKDFILAVGEHFDTDYSFEGRTVKFTYSPMIDHISPNAISFLENTEHLEMVGFNNLRSFRNWGRLIELRKCYIIRCKNIKYIWSFSEGSSGTAASWLRCLEYFEIGECPKLYTLFKGIPNIGALSCLKKLYIWECHNLKNVFSSSRLLQQLQYIEEIYVADCDTMEDFIGGEEENRNTTTTIELPRLKVLSFMYLHKLKSIWRGVMVCSSLEVVRIIDCLALKGLPQLKGEEQSPLPPPALKEIRGSEKWWESLEWDPAYPKNILHPLWCGILPKKLGELFLSDVNVHYGVGCDYCEMEPIVGKRYKCKECYEEDMIGFDLCEECYHTLSKHPDYVNQHHNQGHSWELMANCVHPDGTSGDAEYGFVALSSQSDGDESSQSDAEGSSQSDGEESLSQM